MESEGMVHALEQIHRLLVPGGNLIDIHPFYAPVLVEVYQRGRVVFSQPLPDSCAVEYRKAGNALKQVVRSGLFRLTRKGRFDYRVYGSSVKELRDYDAEEGAFKEPSNDEAEAAREEEFIARVEAVMQSAGEGAEAASHERAHIALLRAVK
jgi:hypothetical protein